MARVSRPSLAYPLAWVEEPGHSRANGSDSPTASSLNHRLLRFMRYLPIGWYIPYVFQRRVSRFNPQPRVVGCARDHDRPQRRCTKDNISACAGDHDKINISMVRETMGKQIPPLFLLVVVFCQSQRPSKPVRICAKSTDLYQEAEYPRTYHCILIKLSAIRAQSSFYFAFVEVSFFKRPHPTSYKLPSGLRYLTVESNATIKSVE